METQFFDSADPRANRTAALAVWRTDPTRTVMYDGAGRYVVGSYPSLCADIAAYMAPEDWEWLEEDGTEEQEFQGVSVTQHRGDTAMPDGYTIFQGKYTRQIDGHTGYMAHDERWYFEPLAYEGDLLWSEGYATQAEAEQAAREEQDDV